MDARSRRSREKLRAAVVTLAARTPINEISVAAVCREAGITRDTFYRHATDPVALLSDALAAELDAVITQLPERDGIGEAERALLAHVQQYADVYRAAMHPVLAAPVRSMLERAIREGLETWVRMHPHIVPSRIAGDPPGVRLATAYATAGTIGAIEVWLSSGEDDIDRAVEVILAASPEWWLR